jgi:hypothetical protein
MASLEQEVKEFLTKANIKYEEGCNKFDKLDFCIRSQENRGDFHFDAKEKMQRISTGNWPMVNIPEEYLFIIDDLATRKILMKAPRSGVVIRDNLNHRYFFATVLDLFLMPRRRVNRDIQKSVMTRKGKWLIDLRNCIKCNNLSEVMIEIIKYLNSFKMTYEDMLECYGTYVGETIEKGGIVRQPKHWENDVSSTR